MDEFEESMGMDVEEASSLEDMKKDTYSDPLAGSIVGLVQKHYKKASDARETEETRWIQAYRNYRGLYGPDVQFTSTEKSQVFVKVTKTKVLAAYGQIIEVLFGNNKFPITVDPTTLPEGVEESVHFESNDEIKKAQGPSPEETKLLPGETITDLKERLAGLKNKLAPVEDQLKEGTGSTPTEITFHPAMVAAKKMEKKIHDQLEESNANKQLRVAAFECALFGTGVMKGPFAIDREYPNWNDEGEYSPTIKTIPQTSSVSIWNFYPDPDAANMDEAEYVVERHKMSRSQMRALKRRPFFRSNTIDLAIDQGESYTKEWWEQAMEDDAQESKAERFEVLEFWGSVDTEVLEGHDIDIPSELAGMDQVNVNIWVCNGKVLRLVMNPFTPSIIPYYAVPNEISPYILFSISIAENLEDTKTLMKELREISKK